MSLNGYAGKILRVDLTAETLTDETLDEATLRKWVGGVGLGAKYLYEEVPPGVEWDDPENCLIIASGPLGGTRAGGSGMISISTKGPLTNGATSTQANGFMGAYMKFAGYDAIVVTGQANRWVYLYMHDGVAELRDAAAVMGKDTWETEDAIKAELGYTERGMSVLCVGPAGENGVKFAGIFGDKDHAAGHNGVGAVMGAKHLKAFCAARGRGSSVQVAQPQRVGQIAKEIWDVLQSYPQGRHLFNWGTGGTYESSKSRMSVGTLPIRNYTTNFYPESDLMTNEHTRATWSAKMNPCWACIQHHCHMITFTDGPYKGQTVEEPEYEMYAAWGPLVGNGDPAETLILANLNTRLGLESNEAGFLLSMVIELYEKGELSPEDTGGLELKWGNTAAMRTLLERIAMRDGHFANVLAEGTMRAAEALGPSAMQAGIYAKKGHSPRGHDHRAMWREMFDTATADIATYQSGYMGPADPASGIPGITDAFSPEQVSTNVAKATGRRQFEDTLGTCVFCTRVPLQHIVDQLNAVTGWDFTLEEAQQVGFRAANVMRVFNVLHGITPASEQPSTRWSTAPIDGPAEGKSVRPHWEAMLDNYYELMGRDRESGRPLPGTLQALGLDDLVPAIWKQS
ncbi:MAG: aldehyde ferredoxin oxidoreductase C-terminal domain-containing protein [Dehalococcoidia bacterium]